MNSFANSLTSWTAFYFGCWRSSLLLSFLVVFSMFFYVDGLAQNRPNIIWLMAEDISLDIECYGMPSVKTPNLNTLAEEGVMFTRTYCSNPICSPSRSAMMTGTFQSRINAQHQRSNRNVPLDNEFSPFTKLLRDNGYTCILGSNMVMDKGRKIDVNFKHTPIGEWNGIDRFGLFDKYDEMLPEDQPFFAQIQLKVTHRGDWWDKIRSLSEDPVSPDSVVLPPYLADHPVIRLDWAKYLDQIEYMDKEIGSIVSYLKARGMYENTVIIFIGDNGRCNVRGKCYLFDSGLHVPFIMTNARGLPSGTVREELVGTVDITATILDLAGIEIPAFMDGSSVLKDQFRRENVFSSRDLSGEIMEKSRSITSMRYKYIKHYHPEIPFDAYQTYLEFYRPALHIMRVLKWQGRLTPEQAFFFLDRKPGEELYDLINDPHELNNLAKDPEYFQVKNSLENILHEKEHENTPKEEVYHPLIPISVEIYNWVKYERENAFREMLQGKEIGFLTYKERYMESVKSH